MKQQEKRRQAEELPEKSLLPQANRKYRDTVFRMLFGDKNNLLGLYNAVSGSSCEDPGELKIVTLENAVYMGHKNDLAFLAELQLHMYEHQTTINFNMPFRFLQYVSEEYARLAAGENIYGSRRIPLPAPHFVVFYNGVSPFPERKVMRFSDAFPKDMQGSLKKAAFPKNAECPLGKADSPKDAGFPAGEGGPQMELIVQVLNINKGYNEELKKKCLPLKEYMQYVDRVREYTAVMPLGQAVDRAVDECIREGILKDFLLANKAEVKNMSIYEFDEEAYERAIRTEEYERGMEDGIEKGMEKGIEKGIMQEIIEMGLDYGLSEHDILERL
ncbi:MAG: hypothetical protein NC094_10840 [Bacteroidales bacterium]|nr:hypothetical protein [Lachnoclostridium sp.]MCM1385014.1 hypothetical protein [Lachnoclostridium sp.]MCM1465903.1 hypothetical protein [Bacteroidales bacterium]